MHGLHAAAPAAEKDPALQALHEAAPALAEKVPAAQL